MSSLPHKNFRFFCGKLIFLRIFEEKVKKNHINQFKKSENFTMCVYYNDKHLGVNSISVSFYK